MVGPGQDRYGLDYDRQAVETPWQRRYVTRFPTDSATSARSVVSKRELG